MLSQTDVDKIVELLEQRQLSGRAIAVRVGVSRTVVSAIANGRRGRHGRCEPGQPDVIPRAERCPGCGVRVYLPCVACRARDYRLRSRRNAVGHCSVAGQVENFESLGIHRVA